MTSLDSDKRKAAEAQGWHYFHSDALGVDYAVKDTPIGPKLHTADGVAYNPAEISVIKYGPGEVSMAIHNVKKAFEGELVGWEPSTKFS